MKKRNGQLFESVAEDRGEAIAFELYQKQK